MTDKQKIWSNVFTWMYRSFTYFVPGGIALWSFLIAKLIDGEVSIATKMGIGGITTLSIIMLIAIFFYGKHLKSKITKLTNQCIECIDNEQKAKLVADKKKYESKQEIFHNACFIAPFVLIWLVLCMVEKGVVSLRGTFMFISMSMTSGLGFNKIAQVIKNSSKGANENESGTDKD